MTKSLRLAKAALRPYSLVRGRKDFTQHQLFAVLALKTDYRGAEAFLRGFAEIRGDLGLKNVPHYSTLSYAENRLLQRESLPSPAPPRPQRTAA